VTDVEVAACDARALFRHPQRGRGRGRGLVRRRDAAADSAGAAKTIGVTLCGGNVDRELFARVLAGD
jgi:hypothetical protein